MAPSSLPSRSAFAATLLLFAGCAVGPNYRRPDVAAPQSYSEEGTAWKVAAPDDGAVRGAWWEMFQDPDLNAIETEAAQANLTLRQAADAYEEARQIAREDRSTFLPAISALGSVERAKQAAGNNSGSFPVPTGPTTTYTGALQAGWEPDFWGKIRRQTEADVAAAQASAADLALARLSLQASLAQDYVGLRVLDEKNRLLNRAVDDYRRTLDITKNKYSVGVAARSDVISAQAQLDSTRAQAIDVGVQRAQLEHAIAVLLGRLPEGFSIAPRPAFDLAPPSIPPQLPGALLERRPDIASAERAVAQANAKVGIQVAAYFPDFTLSAEGGYEGSPLDRLFTAPFRFWSLGANATETLFDAGERRAELLGARAAWDSSAANYRQTVLTAFQQVEDNLAGLRILGQEAAMEDAAVAEATDASRIAQNEYKAGTVDYTTVVTAQVAELTDRESDLGVLQGRLDASVALLQALGGGWTASDLPTRGQIMAHRSPKFTGQ